MDPATLLLAAIALLLASDKTKKKEQEPARPPESLTNLFFPSIPSTPNTPTEPPVQPPVVVIPAPVTNEPPRREETLESTFPSVPEQRPVPTPADPPVIVGPAPLEPSVYYPPATAPTPNPPTYYQPSYYEPPAPKPVYAPPSWSAERPPETQLNEPPSREETELPALEPSVYYPPATAPTPNPPTYSAPVLEPSTYFPGVTPTSAPPAWTAERPADPPPRTRDEPRRDGPSVPAPARPGTPVLPQIDPRKKQDAVKIEEMLVGGRIKAVTGFKTSFSVDAVLFWDSERDNWIACGLSAATEQFRFSVLDAWMEGEEITFRYSSLNTESAPVTPRDLYNFRLAKGWLLASPATKAAALNSMAAVLFRIPDAMAQALELADSTPPKASYS